MSDVLLETPLTEKRWDPIGAPDDGCNTSHFSDIENDDKMKNIERDKELLSSSLFALTSHFAQVQLRLRQVLNASPEEKEQLLESLEEFACHGIPDINIIKERRDETSLLKEIREKRQQQKGFLKDLEKQLTEFENYTFKRKQSITYENVIIERYRLIMKELKTRINLEVDEENLKAMGPDDISKQIISSLNQLTAPLRFKEQLVGQLKAQIGDLEQFIQFLQSNKNHCTQKQKKISLFGVLQKFVTAFEIIGKLQLGCAFKQFQKTRQNETMQVQQKKYNKLHVKLEKHVTQLRNLVEGTVISNTNSELTITKLVKENLATSISNLMQHGTCNSTVTSLAPFTSCCFLKPIPFNSQIQAWDILLKYYVMQNEKSPKSICVTNLFKSFNLDPEGSSESSSPRLELLWCIKNIISMHEPYKSNAELQFQAFVCSALNTGKLVSWLQLVFTNKELLKECYLPWSYVARTRFRDALLTLETLTHYKFDLPVNITVQHFQDIKDVFY